MAFSPQVQGNRELLDFSKLTRSGIADDCRPERFTRALLIPAIRITNAYSFRGHHLPGIGDACHPIYLEDHKRIESHGPGPHRCIRRVLIHLPRHLHEHQLHCAKEDKT